jgi:hypothetical protein
MVRGGSFTGRGEAATLGNHGIRNRDDGTTLAAESVTAVGEDGSGDNCGLDNSNGGAAMVGGGSFTGRRGANPSGIRNGGGDTTLQADGVAALAENGSAYNYGLLNRFGAAATLRGGSFIARAANYAEGIRNAGSGSTLEAEGVSALAENGTLTNYGLSNWTGGAATLCGGSFTGRGGSGAYGILNTYGTTLEAEKITAAGEDGSTNNYGLSNSSSATANVTQSMLEGATHSVSHDDSGSVYVSNSRLAGNAVSGTVTCVAVSRNVTFNANGCP